MLFKKKKIEEKEETTPSTLEPIKEEHEKKVDKNHNFFRISTLCLSLALLCFSLYCVGSCIISGRNSTEDASYITLSNKTVIETKNILSAFGKEKQKKASDYAFLGTKFFLSENRLTPESMSQNHFFCEGNYDNFSLYDITHSTTKVNATDFSFSRYSIDFSHVGEGDYLLYPFSDEGSITLSSDYHFYSLKSEETISSTIYTLPDNNGERNRITFRNNKLSPYSLFQVKKAGSVLPEDYYDAVLFYQEYSADQKNSPSEESIDKLNSIATALEEETSYKIKVCSSLEEAVSTKATISLCVSPTIDSIFTSFYTKTKVDSYQTATLTSGELVNYDSIPEIRENLGYLGRAGECHDGVLGNDTGLTTSHLGKESFLLHDEKVDILFFLQSL